MVSVVELKRLLQECVKYTAEILHFFLCSLPVCVAKLKQQMLFLSLGSFKARSDLHVERAQDSASELRPEYGVNGISPNNRLLSPNRGLEESSGCLAPLHRGARTKETPRSGC